MIMNDQPSIAFTNYNFTGYRTSQKHHSKSFLCNGCLVFFLKKDFSKFYQIRVFHVDIYRK